MVIVVISRYRSGDVEYAPGQVLHLSDGEAELLLRDSPGSFRPAEPEEENARTVDLSAVSDETATGIDVPDRRMRGGRKRGEE